MPKACDRCYSKFTGFGTTCSSCRKAGRRGSIIKCGECEAYFVGFGFVCFTCQTGHAIAEEGSVVKCRGCGQYFHGFGFGCSPCSAEASSQEGTRPGTSEHPGSCSTSSEGGDSVAQAGSCRSEDSEDSDVEEDAAEEEGWGCDDAGPEVGNRMTFPFDKGSCPSSEGGALTSAKPRLSRDYQLHKDSVIGRGSSGVVYSCQHRKTEREFAVKMVEEGRTPLSWTYREIEMLTKLAHPNVMKLVDIYHDKLSIYMVMENYRGGDMLAGCLRHWGTRNMIPVAAVKNLARQTWNAIAWIHSNSCVHRDVKYDNIMMDNIDIADPVNRVYLADFGTVIDVVPGSRLNDRCGSKPYWAPEFWRLDYALLVDCWAVGVLMHGLFTTNYPFKDYDEVMDKELRYSSRVPAAAVDLLRLALERTEARRCTAKVALEHPFLSDSSEENLHMQNPLVGARVTV